MTKRIISILLSMSIIFLTITSSTYSYAANVNPTRQDLEKRIEEVAKRRGIPSVILKSIARVESVFQQYNDDGSVYTGSRGSIGLMQIHNVYGWFDNDRLMYDIDYNIEAGADVLLMKWDTANEKLPAIGNMDPNILEHWYFALWAYNGWVESNNPNMIPYKYSTWTKNHTFQQLIYKVAKEEYGQDITPIDPGLLPKEGLPDDTPLNTPEVFHYGDINKYEPGDLVQVDARISLTLRDDPEGNEIQSLARGTQAEIIAEPVLKNGYYWYKLKVSDTGLEGWVAGNWIVKIGKSYPLNDIYDSWAKEDIKKLYDLNIITGDDKGNFYPDEYITRLEMAILIFKTLGLEDLNYPVDFADNEQIPTWAYPYIRGIVSNNLIVGYSEDNTFRPNENITREQTAVIVSRVLGASDYDYELELTDKDDISPWALGAVKNVYLIGVMGGTEGSFRPKDMLTRAEAAKIMSDIYDFVNKEKQ